MIRPRSPLCYSKWVLILTLAWMTYGFLVHAQSQDAINATLSAQQQALDRRVTDDENRNERRFSALEEQVKYGLYGIYGNLVATLIALLKWQQAAAGRPTDQKAEV